MKTEETIEKLCRDGRSQDFLASSPAMMLPSKCAAALLWQEHNTVVLLLITIHFI
jgi:hypothetical protein